MTSWDARTWIDIVTLIAAIVSATFFIYYVILIRKQLQHTEETLKESINTNRLQALTFIFRDLSSPESRENRRYILLDLKNDSWKDLPPPLQLKVIEVWGSFDQIAYMIKVMGLPKKLVIDMWGNAIKSIYLKSKKQLDECKEERIENLVMENKKDNFSEKEAREYMKYFTELAEEITQSSDKGK